MTINEIRHVVEMIEECKGTSNPVDTVWEYTNVYNHEIMYAVFTKACYNDIHSSPAVDTPTCIFRDGKFIGGFTYLNVEIE